MAGSRRSGYVWRHDADVGSSDFNSQPPMTDQLRDPASAGELDLSNQLYWSKKGDVACGSHAPFQDAQRWASEGWSRIESEFVKRNLQCPHCHAGVLFPMLPRQNAEE
jgi:hypothetical protein